MTPTPPPDDVIEGADPSVDDHCEIVQSYKLTCLGCGHVVVAEQAAAARHSMDVHMFFGHPAYRNPDITCQATPVWDHDRWCIRPKDHDGKHWTPSFNGGMSWD